MQFVNIRIEELRCNVMKKVAGNPLLKLAIPGGDRILSCEKIFSRLIFVLIIKACIVFCVYAQEEGPSVMQSLGTMKVIVPDMKTVGILCNPEKNEALLKKAQKGAAILQLNIVLIEVKSMSDYSTQYRSAISDHHLDFLWVPGMDDNILSAAGKEFLFKNAALDRIPLMVPTPDLAGEGALCALKVTDGKLEIYLNNKLAQFFQITIPEEYKEKVKYVGN